MLAKEYFSDKGMLAYVQGVQRIEIRTGVECVKHQVICKPNTILLFFIQIGLFFQSFQIHEKKSLNFRRENNYLYIFMILL